MKQLQDTSINLLLVVNYGREGEGKMEESHARAGGKGTPVPTRRRVGAAMMMERKMEGSVAERKRSTFFVFTK